jgi:hypothetical protein
MPIYPNWGMDFLHEAIYIRWLTAWISVSLTEQASFNADVAIPAAVGGVGLISHRVLIN